MTQRKPTIPHQVRVRATVRAAVCGLALSVQAVALHADEPVRYRFTFPAPEHRWMQVEVALAGLPAPPLELRMSRSSPGRYAVHDFAKNVYDVEAFAPGGQPLDVRRSDPHGWTIDRHGGAVTVRYKVFGDQLDGTYLAIDSSHAHINMPAAVMWARGLDDRAATLAFEPPAGADDWVIATQLFPGGGPRDFTAPNLQYLMDSPVEFGPLVVRQFAAGDQTIRVAVHHTGAPREVDRLARDLEAIVGEHGEIYGEYPRYEQGQYTFIADSLPYANFDAMEHRNSTVITGSATLGSGRIGLLDAASHEFFHGWNVERIRPRSLEPFDFERANMAGELWLGEGFTQYYGPLVLARAGLIGLETALSAMLRLISSMASNPARLVRSAIEMSQMAPFVDGGVARDRTNWASTVISYYDFGGAIALALDLTLRERSGGEVTLDTYMRAMWREHGAPGGSRPGFVDRPYSLADAEARLAEVAGDPAFARDFFARYIEGHEVADYTRLLALAGLVLRRAHPGQASMGGVRLEDGGGSLRVASLPPFDSPLYRAGLNVGDDIQELDGRRIRTSRDVADVLSRRRPGDTMPVGFVDRGGRSRRSAMTLVEDETLELVAVEETGRTLTSAQRLFRSRWMD